MNRKYELEEDTGKNFAFFFFSNKEAWACVGNIRQIERGWKYRKEGLMGSKNG